MFLTCQVYDSVDPVTYVAEDQAFHNDPCFFIDQHLPPMPIKVGHLDEHYTYAWTTHIAVFNFILAEQCTSRGSSFGEYLASKGYVEERRFWNTFRHIDREREGDIVILSLSSASG